MSTGATETAAAAVQLPSKKRKASHDSAVAATAAAAAAASTASTTTTTTTTPTTPAVVPRKESEGGSQASEGTVSFKSTLDGTSLGGVSSNKVRTNFPPKKRKASFDIMSLTSTSDGPLRKRKLSEGRPRLSSVGSIDDAALGLGPLDVSAGSAAIADGLIGCDNMTLESHTLDNDHETVMTIPVPQTSTGALDHLEALGDEASIARFRQRASIRDEEESQASSSNNTMANGDRQLLIEALMGNSLRRRDRLESWGGMSDISLTMGSTGFSAGDAPFMGEGTAAAAAIAASALQRPFLEDESDESTVSEADKPVPSKISLGRDRLYSIASLGEPSVNGAYEMGPDLQLYVAAAMANVGDHLAELAGVVEIVAGGSNSVGSDLLKDIIRDDHSDVMSTASSLPEIQAELRRQRQEDRAAGRTRSLSTSSNPLSVDYDAVAAAVDAAEAATGALGLTSFGGSGRSRADDSNSSLLPLIPSSSNKDDRDMEAMRARARAAAGYIPPENLKPGEIPPPSTKKRPKPTTPHHKTIYNKARHHSFVPEQTYSMYNAANKASSQKWDEMYECLVEFVEEQKVDTRGMTEKERKEVEWDGNVPTTYRTKDGKALGRWINNQRSAKHKECLRKREIKLMSTGLKWSVLSTNSWQDMMEELQLYVSEKTKDGSEWDGNVPTNYKIKGGTCLDEDGEERNLGRWINRQRSLYQSGKLRKDREAELEAIGLKWSVLSTTSWQSMYETLVEYVEERKTIDGDWDGNVPANYKQPTYPQGARKVDQSPANGSPETQAQGRICGQAECARTQMVSP
ncbi:hypothetical protein MHU86_3229 [Fragilaria crotonensis]|nr:hypothetical protein MHU86_3229 [Fragilaria crotonensis]